MYSDPEMQRKYQREWIRRRRESHLNGRRCELCGTGSELEVDHIVPLAVRPRPMRHRIWSYSDERRETELAGTRVLCRRCNRAESYRAIGYPGSKLDVAAVKAIRAEIGTTPINELASRYGVRPEAVRDAATGKTWRILPDERHLADLMERAA